MIQGDCFTKTEAVRRGSGVRNQVADGGTYISGRLKEGGDCAFAVVLIPSHLSFSVKVIFAKM